MRCSAARTSLLFTVKCEVLRQNIRKKNITNPSTWRTITHNVVLMENIKQHISIILYPVAVTTSIL